jgi:hypothetical protein
MASPRIPRLNEKGKKYWENKGKVDNEVMLYTHDDMDGIYSAVVAKSRLENLGYKIVGYGVLNYQESWRNTSLNPDTINVVVDFANMPDPDRKDLVDIYIDHHGDFSEEEKEFYKSNQAIKTDTGSAYEGICNILNYPTDEITLYSIDMIDSAKYEDYHVDWKDILDFNWDKFKEIASKEGTVTIKPFKDSNEVTLGWPIIAKLTFAGAFNQLIKRGDHKTIIEVIDNIKDCSIYGIYNVMKKIYPGNNIWTKGKSISEGKDFVSDGKWRINTMKSKTRGKFEEKKIYTDQKSFYEDTLMKPSGYQLINNLAFIPSGTWANALRARAILLQDYDSGVIPKEHDIDFIMLQYGNTIQVCGFNKFEHMEEHKLPVLKDGFVVKDLAEYMAKTLSNFKKHFGYYDLDTQVGQEELTVSGGHVGIGTISNIVGKVDGNRPGKSEISKDLVSKYHDKRFLDLFKNKIIADLSGLNENWNISLVWSTDGEDKYVLMIREIINKDPNIQSIINQYVEDNKGSDTEYQLKKSARDMVKSNLMQRSPDEIEELHRMVMLDHKVMMKREIRQIDLHGNIPTREEWENSN